MFPSGLLMPLRMYKPLQRLARTVRFPFVRIIASGVTLMLNPSSVSCESDIRFLRKFGTSNAFFSRMVVVRFLCETVIVASPDPLAIRVLAPPSLISRFC